MKRRAFPSDVATPLLFAAFWEWGQGLELTTAYVSEIAAQIKIKLKLFDLLPHSENRGKSRGPLMLLFVFMYNCARNEWMNVWGDWSESAGRGGVEGGGRGISPGPRVITDRLLEFPSIQLEPVLALKTKWKNKVSPSSVLF